MTSNRPYYMAAEKPRADAAAWQVNGKLECSVQADVAILDEIDSGLDIDALRDVARAVNGLKRDDSATIMVTHYKVHSMEPSFTSSMPSAAAKRA